MAGGSGRRSRLPVAENTGPGGDRMRGEAFWAVQARLGSFQASGDRSCLLDLQASEEMTALRAAIGWPTFGPLPPGAAVRRDLDAIVLAGRFSWARCHELPGPDRLDALLEATELFAAAYPYSPGSVPPQAAEVCAALTARGGVDPAELHNDALDRLDGALSRQDLQAVDQAIWQLASAVLAAHDDPAEPFFLSSLGSAWLDRFKITGRPRDIDSAVSALRRAVPAPAPLWERAGRRADLSAALLKRFELCGGIRDLDDAVSIGREAAGLARSARADLDPTRAGRHSAEGVMRAWHVSLSNLGAVLASSFERRAMWPDLDEAIQVSREVAACTACDAPAHAADQANLANVLLDRFSQSWQVVDLEEAFIAAQAGVAGVPTEDLARAPCLSSLALAYANRFAYTGELNDLAQAISAGHEAVTTAPDGHPGKAACLSNLGVALNRRYEQVGDTDALDEAITVLRKAVSATTAGPRRAGYLNNLGYALRNRFAAATEGVVTLGSPKADIQKSVAALEEAVAVAGSQETGRPGYVANLALSLVMSAESGADPDALQRAISILEREADTVGDSNPLVGHVYFASLGNAWRARFDVTSDEDALQNAITWFRKAVDAVPEDHPRRSGALASLGSALLRRSELTSSETDAREALDACKPAAGIATAPALTRALAARTWGEAAATIGDAHEAADGFAAAVNLLDTVAWRRLRRGDQERRLGRLVALACDAAAWAIAADQPGRAVELLEQGRGILLAQSLDERARYHDLARADKHLADRLAAIDQVLEHLPSIDNPLIPAAQARRRAELTAQRDVLLRQIRRLPGLADFLMPPEFASLRDAAVNGPVIVINVSRYRCDALIVTASGVSTARLGELTGATAVARAVAFMDALRQLTTAGTGQEIISATLPWLWDTIASPLMPVLQDAVSSYHQASGQRPHIWWCPTGPLTFLPLHAAGHHDRPGGSVLDHFASSYAPTLRLLRQAHQALQPPAGGGTPLLVALPLTPGLADLPAARQEADDFARRFSDATRLCGPDATAAATLHALSDSPPWAHFACHGTQDISDPSAGHLALHDGPLSIGTISGLRLDGTDLAFLSACETFRGGAELADEAITLATAFSLAGYRHVIGTLWSISDALAPLVANTVYHALTQPGRTRLDARGSARALDTAILALRESNRTESWFWAPYIHIGP